MFDAYEENRIDRLYIASNDFVNTMVQSPVMRQLLPLNPDVGRQPPSPLGLPL